MIKKIIIIISAIGFLCNIALANDKLNVITTTADLMDIVKTIGNDKVNVSSLARGTQDLHAVEPRPSMALLIRKANLIIRVGMDLDMWVNSLIDLSQNSSVALGTPGSLDVSKGIEKLEVPVGKVDFAMGDVHIYGNPHFWLDPENGEIIAREIRDKFIELLPQDKDYFEKNYNEFIAQLNTSIKKWEEELKPLAGLKVVTYHDSLTYFAKRFGINIIGQIELRPAIPPHLLMYSNWKKK